jgi:hypothetical protein
MPQATSLRDLLTIRKRHLPWLRKLPGYLGSSVGYKFRETDDDFAAGADGKRIPAIHVFVQKKLKPAKVAPKNRVPEKFTGPRGLWCAGDVVTGTWPDERPRVPRPSRANAALIRSLREEKLGFIGGMPIVSPTATGTTSCAIRVGAAKGLLTNWHVAGALGSRILRPSPRLQIVGYTRDTQVVAPHTPRDPDDLESFTDARHRIDAAFVGFPQKPGAAIKLGVFGLGALGKPYVLDIDTMGPIGRDVQSIGQASGLQKGRVVAYGYEWQTDTDSEDWEATDYLILGSDTAPFAAPGDSGKLIVTADDARQPIALLWGGQRQGFWNAHAQDAWAYASDIGAVLENLGAKILPS